MKKAMKELSRVLVDIQYKLLTELGNMPDWVEKRVSYQLQANNDVVEFLEYIAHYRKIGKIDITEFSKRDNAYYMKMFINGKLVRIEINTK
jgi:hypothetical protein